MSRHVQVPGSEFLDVDHGVSTARGILLALGDGQGVQEVGHDVPGRHGLLGAEGPIGRPHRHRLAGLEHGELVDGQDRVALLLGGRRGRGRGSGRRRRGRGSRRGRGRQARRVELPGTVLQKEAAVLALEVHLDRGDRVWKKTKKVFQ